MKGDAMNSNKTETRKHDQIDQLLTRLDASGIAEYVKLSQRTGRILWLNFLSGVARGLGFTIGTTLVLAILYKILSRIISMNIPYITEWLQKIIALTTKGTPI